MTAIEIKMTITQVQALKRFGEQIRKDYESGLYDFDIKCCLREHSLSSLLRSVFAFAAGFFHESDIPFSCVYAFCYNFVQDTLAIYGF